jgi:hypothetical protein
MRLAAAAPTLNPTPYANQRGASPTLQAAAGASSAVPSSRQPAARAAQRAALPHLEEDVQLSDLEQLPVRPQVTRQHARLDVRRGAAVQAQLGEGV